MNEAPRILVAEDDLHIREGLVDMLESEGYAVVAAADGRAAVAAWETAGAELVLLDIMMPGLNGYDVCREIRRTNASVPILMLTAKGQEIDKVIGLELGADDYITKPFGVRELLARVHAALRRARLAAPPPAPTVEDDIPESFRFGEALIHRRTYRGTLGEEEFDLTSREMELIICFHQHPHEVLRREELMQMVWGQRYYGTTRTLDQHIAQLRKKIEADPHNPAVITTAHGIGYRYEG